MYIESMDEDLMGEEKGGVGDWKCEGSAGHRGGGGFMRC